MFVLVLEEPVDADVMAGDCGTGVCGDCGTLGSGEPKDGVGGLGEGEGALIVSGVLPLTAPDWSICCCIYGTK